MGELIRRYRYAGRRRPNSPIMPGAPMFDPWGPIIVLDARGSARYETRTR